MEQVAQVVEGGGGAAELAAAEVVGRHRGSMAHYIEPTPAHQVLGAHRLPWNGACPQRRSVCGKPRQAAST